MARIEVPKAWLAAAPTTDVMLRGWETSCQIPMAPPECGAGIGRPVPGFKWLDYTS
jgi:hypothetical protein